ncbi:DUF2523 domain-containing protein, partial [Pseudomonas aeruginosa]|nr:DUF2523 domain-containing protein [Pseudomonas aeruginosa]
MRPWPSPAGSVRRISTASPGWARCPATWPAGSGSAAYVFSNLGGVPAQWLQVLGLLQVDVCINILFSAYIARAVLWGM